LGTTALAALQGIDDALHLKPGGIVIIHGASGGVESLAIAGPREYERLNQAIEEAHLQVPIAAEYALADAAQAQQRMEAGHIFGKIVLRTH
jgi:NADPH:quinone reductase-like Zn-dependent oxidoreductase